MANTSVIGNCRICSTALQDSFCDLGTSPPANSYITSAELSAGNEVFYPLHAYVCGVCNLVQLQAFETPSDIFSDYAYFSSFSSTFLEHARDYCHMITSRLALSEDHSFVVEIASNDGYLLQNFVSQHIRVLGVEPAANVAEVARQKNVPTEVAFFGVETATSISEKHGLADLIIGNNVIAHVPDLHDFIGGVKIALSRKGTATFEFPHLLHLVEKVQFDTIYHEHFSYFALAPLQRAFSDHGLKVTDVEEISTHGGSLRIYVQHAGAGEPSAAVTAMLNHEKLAGLQEMSTYARFQQKVDRRRADFVSFLERSKSAQDSVVGYGAPAKASTLLNYCRVGPELMPFTADLSPHKQGRLMPGSHVPIVPPSMIFESRPDVIFIFAWNLRNEIEHQLRDARDWGAKFAAAIPQLNFS